jgi:hypothetical protein
MQVVEKGSERSLPDPGSGSDVRCQCENGKPDVSRGRKATGPSRSAGLPHRLLASQLAPVTPIGTITALRCEGHHHRK